MTSRVLVLGAAGRLGCRAAEAFRAAGWSVRAWSGPAGAARAVRTEVVEVHALDYDAVAEARAAPTLSCTRSARPIRTGRGSSAARLFRHQCGGNGGATLLFPAISTITARRCRRRS
jgi:NAD(P)-dependent dehydrogenase (short-subunit alcohol dehydrogenase family)